MQEDQKRTARAAAGRLDGHLAERLMGQGALDRIAQHARTVLIGATEQGPRGQDHCGREHREGQHRDELAPPCGAPIRPAPASSRPEHLRAHRAGRPRAAGRIHAKDGIARMIAQRNPQGEP